MKDRGGPVGDSDRSFHTRCEWFLPLWFVRGWVKYEPSPHREGSARKENRAPLAVCEDGLDLLSQI